MTFSMVARCLRTYALGVVTCTSGRAVGSVVPHAKEGVGAVATQHTTNVFHGLNSLRLLEERYEPSHVLRSTLALDPEPEVRQVLIVDREGHTAAHTGGRNLPWCGHRLLDRAVAGGNDLKGERVLEAMCDSFEGSIDLSLHERLLRAVEAGFAAGGCTGPDHTAALKVVGVEDSIKMFWRPYIDLRIDWSEDAQPTRDLRRLYENYKVWISERKSVNRT